MPLSSEGAYHRIDVPRNQVTHHEKRSEKARHTDKERRLVEVDAVEQRRLPHRAGALLKALRLHYRTKFLNVIEIICSQWKSLMNPLCMHNMGTEEDGRKNVGG